MKANNPITARVQAAFKNLTTPTNQEVTLNADGSGGPIVAPDGRVVNEPKKKQKSSTEDCGCAGSAKGAAAPAKQTAYTDKLYNKSQKLTDKAKNAADEGKLKKAARLENRAARVDKREEKKRAKYNY